MKKLFAAATAVIVAIALTLLLLRYWSDEGRDMSHYEREETELIITNLSGGSMTLFKAGKTLTEASAMPKINGDRVWLPPGNYFLRVEKSGRSSFYPIPLVGYRGGPDKDGTFTVTIRPLPPNPPPRLFQNLLDFAYIPSGYFLFGDRLRVNEPHYIWLTGFFLSPFEVTNADFREFLNDPRGYGEDTNWTVAGVRWKTNNPSHATALLKETDADFKRFGYDDLPVVGVNWFEAAAYCRWLTKRTGRGKWIFSLPTEAQWEKAARGPDSFDYSLSTNISDAEMHMYNWKKNPGAAVTAVGLQTTAASYRPNRYGLYHMTGNVSEWNQSVYRSYSRQYPFVDDERNKDNTPGERVVRGGSWYTATAAVLYIPYRENFQPEIQTLYLGFRVAARPLP